MSCPFNQPRRPIVPAGGELWNWTPHSGDSERISKDVAINAADEVAETKSRRVVNEVIASFQDSLQSAINKLWVISLGALALGLGAIVFSLIG